MKKRLSAAAVVLVLLVCMVTDVSAKNSIKSKSVVIDAGAVTLEPGNIATLTAYMKPLNSTDSLSWKSSDENIATVNKYGVVTAIAPGSAQITVKTGSKKTAECAVTVKAELTKEEIEELVRSKLLSEDSIKKLITDNTISEEAVKKIVSENTLTEEDVRAIVAEGGKEDSWTDGAEVPMISEQKLPLLISDSSTPRTNIVGNIKTIKVTKRRANTSIYQNGVTRFLPFRYDVILTAEVPAITDVQKTTYYAELTLGSVNVPNIIQANDPYTASFAGTTLTEILAVYSAYDVDEFYIESAVWKARP